MTDGRALHGTFHGAGTTAGADVQSAQSQLIAHFLGIIVFLAANRVAAPAHRHSRRLAGTQCLGIAQDTEHGVGQTDGAAEIEPGTTHHLVIDVDDIAQHRKKVLADTTDHLAIDKGPCRGIADLDADAILGLHQLDVESGVRRQHRPGIIDMAPRVEHRQTAAAERLVQPAYAAVAKVLDLPLGQNLQAAFRTDNRIDAFNRVHDSLVGLLYRRGNSPVIDRFIPPAGCRPDTEFSHESG